MVVGRIYLQKKVAKTWYLFFSFFLMCITIWGNEFNFFLHKRVINSARRVKIDPKVGTFCRIGIRDLAILGVKKVVFWRFSKLFWSCLGSV